MFNTRPHGQWDGFEAECESGSGINKHGTTRGDRPCRHTVIEQPQAALHSRGQQWSSARRATAQARMESIVACVISGCRTLSQVTVKTPTDWRGRLWRLRTRDCAKCGMFNATRILFDQTVQPATQPTRWTKDLRERSVLRVDSDASEQALFSSWTEWQRMRPTPT